MTIAIPVETSDSFGIVFRSIAALTHVSDQAIEVNSRESNQYAHCGCTLYSLMYFILSSLLFSLVQMQLRLLLS